MPHRTPLFHTRRWLGGVCLAWSAWASAQHSCVPVGQAPADLAEPELYAAGQCALEVRDFDLAVPLLQALVARADHAVYRADLGRAYLGALRFEDARSQFMRALQSGPPPRAQALLQTYLHMAEQGQTQAKTWQGQVAVGLLRDTNVNAGPSSPEVLLYGLPFVLNADGLPRAAGGLQTTASFSHHTVVHPGLSWASSVLAETVHLPTAQAYSTRMLQVETGPHFTWDQGRFDLHLPAQASRIWRGGSGHQHTTGWSPQWRWRLDEGHSLTVGLGGSRQGLDDAPAMDLTRREARVGWRLQPWAGWSLEPQWRWASERANDEAFSNRQHGWALSLGGTLSPHWRLQADVGRMRVTHRAAESWADAPRNDTRDTASLALTRHLSGAWYATLGWQRWLTRSNLGLYQQQRTQVRATLSHSF